jgi:hypothetical protein
MAGGPFAQFQLPAPAAATASRHMACPPTLHLLEKRRVLPLRGLRLMRMVSLVHKYCSIIASLAA